MDIIYDKCNNARYVLNNSIHLNFFLQFCYPNNKLLISWKWNKF